MKALSTPNEAARRVRLIDRLASGIIRSGGALVIVAVVAAIFLFIGREALPLFFPAGAKQVWLRPVPGALANAPSFILGVDEYESFAYLLPTNGVLTLVGLQDFQVRSRLPVAALQQHKLSAAYRSPSKDWLFLGTTDGNVVLMQLKVTPEYSVTGRSVSARLGEEKVIQLPDEKSSVTRICGRTDSAGRICFAAVCENGKIYYGSVEEGEEPKIGQAGGASAGTVIALAIDSDAKKLFVATSAGDLCFWYLDNDFAKPFVTVRPGEGNRTVTAMDYVIGNNALLLGFSDGTLEEWFGVREHEGDVRRPFRRIRSFEPLDAAVNCLQVSGRDKGFVAGSKSGAVNLYFTTSGRTLLRLRAGASITSLCYTPKLTSILALTARDEVADWAVVNPHPEISWGVLFGKVWYEGYDRPEFNWQSTGGSDDFEAKFSLIPLIIGTLKGAFYGLIFAVPLAVLAALYTSQFMAFHLRALVKPVVEIMAALPSVVIGFLAGLWLAPVLENRLVAVGLLLLIIPGLIFLCASIWARLPNSLRQRFPAGIELSMILPLLLIGGILAAWLGSPVEGLLFGGDFKQWVFRVFGQQFEQRNSIVIGFAMAFAVIPVIFTIAEDSLSNVPAHFLSASLALGASRWQTAIRVILPTASPGIFSAIMIGFGRAVGETMIVLMATGNTPIMSFSPFNGMRTLSANIAVEIPEAPVGGSLYRVLFLAAAMLFLMTFLVNTVAEIIRQRLREKYKTV